MIWSQPTTCLKHHLAKHQVQDWPQESWRYYNVTSDGSATNFGMLQFNDGGSGHIGYHVEKKERNSILCKKN